MKLETIDQKASYAIGLQIGDQFKSSGLTNLDLDALKQAMADVLAGTPPRVPAQELQDALRQIHEQAMKEESEKAKESAKIGTEFLAENSKKEGITVTASGLQYQVLEQGNGDKPTETSQVKVHYTGQLIDGTIFDSSVQRGEPAQFPVNGVIRGWVEALQMMPVGAKWKLYIPHDLAYGEQGAGGSIPPYSALIFEVELLEIVS